jgi:hypothetical protein
MTPGRIATGVWLTAYCAHVLIRSGQAEWAGLGAVPQSGGSEERAVQETVDVLGLGLGR